MMKRKSLLLIVMMFALTSLSTINAQEKKKLIGDYLSISGWMNIQYDYESQLQNDEATLDVISNTFNVRRARLDFKGNISKNVEFRVQGDLAGTPKLVDGFVKVKLHKSFNIQAGQFKIPFTFENPQSPLTLEGIEYAQVISKLSGYSDMSGVKTYSSSIPLCILKKSGWQSKAVISSGTNPVVSRKRPTPLSLSFLSNPRRFIHILMLPPFIFCSFL
jgi:hypothetical protein